MLPLLFLQLLILIPVGDDTNQIKAIRKKGPLPSGFESGLLSLFLFFRFPCTYETMPLKSCFS